NPAKQFSLVRVFGTVGWIAAGLVISYVFQWDAEENVAQGMLRNTFLMTAAASAFLGVFSFTLPKTPPRVDRSEKVSISGILGLDALKLLKDRNFLVFFVASILICIPLAFYYQHAGQFLGEIGVTNPAGKMTMGQASEVVFMLLLPLFFARYGFKKTILFGMLAWVLRYILFTYGNADELVFMLLIGIALHGICYDFFFVSGQIYTETKAGRKYKSAAQGLITLATYGLGMLIGFWIAGEITDFYALGANSHNWAGIWIIPAAFALVVFVLFALLFKNEKIVFKQEL
ncbi:MAG: MFS transporter, partial [Eudoraea sp.]|nr:MFS transporter [Eudoraea sp.]